MNTSPVERVPFSSRADLSVVIPHFYPSRNDKVRKILEDLKGQTFRDLEVLIVHGVAPQGRAINEGARQARGEFLIVMDDDSALGHERVVENLVRVLREDPKVAMAGASIVTPDHANAFQKRAAREFPRFNMPVVKSVTDSDLACHGCVAFRKSVFDAVGMEREDILRGLDPDLRVRIRKAGYRVVLAPDTWVYHPLPGNLSKFCRLFLRNGFGSAYLQIFHPEINFDTAEAVSSEHFVAKKSFAYRVVRYPLRLIRSLLALRFLRFLGYFAYLIGYVGGVIHFGMRYLAHQPVDPATQ